MARQILVVDDDDDVRNMLCVILSAEGYATVGAADGIEALRRIRGVDGPPALIFVDLMMPRMGGEALIRTMRRDPLLAGIPVAVLSGHSRPQGSEPTGAIDARLVKPVELDDLLAIALKFAGPMH
jgi:CheY-like chemotaxis protein